MKQMLFVRRDDTKNIKLAKKLKAFDYFAIGFGSIIGVGWVIVIGDWINIGGGVFTAVAAYVIGAVFLIPIALVYGDLARDIPVAGGAIAYSLNAFGSLPSYFTGWFLALGYIMLCPWETIAIGQILQALFPAIKIMPLYTIGEHILYAPTLLISLLISIIIIIVNFRGIEYVSKIQNLLTLTLLGISILSVFISLTKGSFHNILPMAASTPKNPNGNVINGLFSVLVITPFFYAGFDTIPQGIEELIDGVKPKVLSKTIFLSIIAACFFYILVLFSIAMAMPWQEIFNLSLPAAEVYKIGLKLPLMSKLILIGALCGLITTLNSFFVAGARVLMTLGRAGFLNDSFSRVHPKYRTPYFANTVIAIITLTGPFIGERFLLPITNICSLGFMMAWLMVCLSSIKLGKKSSKKPNNIVRPWLKYLAVILSLIMITLLILPSSPGALSWPIEWGLVVVWVVAGAALYLCSNFKRENIDEENRKRRVLGEYYKKPHKF